MRSQAVLFDFDGTLADTAGDLARALNHVRADQGLAELPLSDLRGHASSGARGLLAAGMGVLPEHPQYEALRLAFLAHYEREICVDTRLFPGMLELLAALEARRLRWGIVTNKSTRLTTMIVPHLPLSTPPGCVVCGDTTPHLKPHPAPLQRAAEDLRIAPADCIYLGDDRRDVLAAQAAGMGTVAVEYGYHSGGEDGPRSWNADRVIARPLDLIPYL